ncbi:MAG: N-6 DNA methylase [Coprobacter fastidiosus]
MWFRLFAIECSSRNGKHGIGKIYGQEKNITTYSWARMNMLLHGVKDTEFEIHHGDSLLNDWNILNEINPSKKIQFDAIVANCLSAIAGSSPRGIGKRLSFVSKTMALHLNLQLTSPSCCMASTFYVKTGQWPLFCHMEFCSVGGKEELIRKKLLTDGNIDAVIGLPSNLFYSTGIPV